MATKDVKKNVRLQISAGGWTARELTPDEWLDRETRSWAARGKVKGSDCRGRYATRAVKDIGGGLRFPEKIPARIITDALEAGAKTEWAREFGRIMDEYAVRKARALGIDDLPKRAA